MFRVIALLAFALLPLSACGAGVSYMRNSRVDAGATQAAASVAYGEGPRRGLDVYTPADADGPAPVIVFFYGGAWSEGAKADYQFAGHAFASRGFVTVVPDYRVYPEVRFPGFVEDAAEALKWTEENIARYGGDPDRLVLVGHSAGAHIAMLAALDPSYAAATGFDRSAIRGVAGLAGPYGFDNFNMPLLRNVFGHVSDPMVVQPRQYVSADGPPLLLLHGDADRRVPVRSTTYMEAAAREAGEGVEAKIYPGVSHAAILGAVSLAERDAAPVLDDVTEFARRVAR